jgi:hypothetical protein
VSHHAVHRTQAGGYSFVLTKQQLLYLYPAKVGLFQRADQAADLVRGRQDAAKEAAAGQGGVRLAQVVPRIGQV